jgi:hypothetical protein
MIRGQEDLPGEGCSGGDVGVADPSVYLMSSGEQVKEVT